MKNNFNKIVDIYIKSKNKYLYFIIIVLFLMVTIMGKYEATNNLNNIAKGVYNHLDNYNE